MGNVRFISQYFSFSSPPLIPEKSKRVFHFNCPYYNNLFRFGVWVQWQACYSSLSCLIVSRWSIEGGECCSMAPVVLTWAVGNYSFTMFSSWFTIYSIFWQGWRGNLSHNVIKLSSKATELVDWELSNSIILVVQMVLKEILQNTMLSWTSVSSRHQCSGHSLVRQAIQRSVVFCSEGEVCGYVITRQLVRGQSLRHKGRNNDRMRERDKGK